MITKRRAESHSELHDVGMAAMMPLSALVLGQMTPMDIMKSKSEAWNKYTSSHMTTGPECAAPSPWWIRAFVLMRSLSPQVPWAL